MEGYGAMDMNSKESKEQLLFRKILRLKMKALGLGLGVLLGAGIFIATNWLVLKGGVASSDGGAMIGPHMELLSQFFIGYKVSFLGSFIGLAYGFAVGTLGGSLIAIIYNKIVHFRHGAPAQTLSSH
jgi:hypothetical protein